VAERWGGFRYSILYEWTNSEDGGLEAREPLAPNGAIDAALPLSRYLAPLPPGKYQSRIYYSDVMAIAGPDEHIGVVAIESDPFELHVLPRVVETSNEEQARFASLIDALPSKAPVQILVGRYGSWADGFVPPQSPAGKLFEAGWRAVPALISYVRRKDGDPVRKGWAFAILYSATGWFKPEDAVGDYEEHWCETETVGGGGMTANSRTGSGAVSAETQAAFAAAWAKVAAAIEVRGVH